MFALLKEDIRNVMAKDPAARSVMDVLTYPGLHAIILHRIAHRLWNRKQYFLARAISQLSRFLTHIEIHPGATIGRRCFIDHGDGVVIGETAVVGDDVLMYHQVTLGGTTLSKGKRHPTIGNGVMIGMGAAILGPISIGDHCRIGSNAVVNKDIPSDCTVVGIPGRIVKRNGESVTAQVVMDNDINRVDPQDNTIREMRQRIEMLEQHNEKLEELIKRIEEHERHPHCWSVSIEES